MLKIVKQKFIKLICNRVRGLGIVESIIALMVSSTAIVVAYSALSTLLVNQKSIDYSDQLSSLSMEADTKLSQLINEHNSATDGVRRFPNKTIYPICYKFSPNETDFSQIYISCGSNTTDYKTCFSDTPDSSPKVAYCIKDIDDKLVVGEIVVSSDRCEYAGDKFCKLGNYKLDIISTVIW